MEDLHLAEAMSLLPHAEAGTEMTQSCCWNTALSTPKNMELPLGGPFNAICALSGEVGDPPSPALGEAVSLEGTTSTGGKSEPGKKCKARYWK